jgi:hypothetical protein
MYFFYNAICTLPVVSEASMWSRNLFTQVTVVTQCVFLVSSKPPHATCSTVQSTVSVSTVSTAFTGNRPMPGLSTGMGVAIHNFVSK